MNIKRAILSSGLIWILGVSIYSASFFVEILDNPEVQANLILAISLIPVAIFGARFYYAKGNEANGFKVGLFMFFIAAVLDALLTVPLLIIPNGGDHFSFFTSVEFWLIAIEYVTVITCYWTWKLKMRTV